MAAALDSDRDILVRIDERTRGLHDELLGPDRESGRIPKLEVTQAEHAKQINFWRGAIAILAIGFVALVGAFAAHVFAGK